tara:strand:- start:912 stop:1250 length:339 start_codon:yes stop_codon:yes gene_type:complete
MSNLSHQDWEQYIIHCKVDKKKEKEKGESIRKQNRINVESRFDDKIEKGELKHKKVNTELKKEFQKWRQSKGYTQKEVAMKLAVPPQTITKFENGQLNHDPKLISKIKRIMK